MVENTIDDLNEIGNVYIDFKGYFINGRSVETKGKLPVLSP
jgi:hypothetical protein